MNEKYMSTNRLEAFYDAIIAIIVTILVLELPQPATASIPSILALKTSYFAYLISFLVCTNLWQYHHLIYNHVERINAKIIWQNIFLLLIVSLIPYLTTFVANNPFSLLAEVLYDLDFIIVNIILFWMAKSLLDFKTLIKGTGCEKCTCNSIHSVLIRFGFCLFRLSFCNQHMLFDKRNTVNCLFNQKLEIIFNINSF